jgi:hypothetical protein
MKKSGPNNNNNISDNSIPNDLAIEALYIAVQSCPKYFESSIVPIDFNKLSIGERMCLGWMDTHSYTSCEITLVSSTFAKLGTIFPRCRAIFTNHNNGIGPKHRMTDNEAHRLKCRVCHSLYPPRKSLHYCI